jgi:hypothetical protein
MVIYCNWIKWFFACRTCGCDCRPEKLPLGPFWIHTQQCVSNKGRCAVIILHGVPFLAERVYNVSRDLASTSHTAKDLRGSVINWASRATGVPRLVMTISSRRSDTSSSSAKHFVLNSPDTISRFRSVMTWSSTVIEPSGCSPAAPAAPDLLWSAVPARNQNTKSGGRTKPYTAARKTSR